MPAAAPIMSATAQDRDRSRHCDSVLVPRARTGSPGRPSRSAALHDSCARPVRFYLRGGFSSHIGSISRHRQDRASLRNAFALARTRLSPSPIVLGRRHFLGKRTTSANPRRKPEVSLGLSGRRSSPGRVLLLQPRPRRRDFPGRSVEDSFVAAAAPQRPRGRLRLR
jgi:hypothetical protein